MSQALSLAASIQRELAGYYDLTDAPPVNPFVRAAAGNGREVLFVRQRRGAVEILLELPPEALSTGERPALDLDVLCQVVEGVSHFLYVAGRARRRRPTTQLELELQAEIDKFVLLAIAGVRSYSPTRASHVHRRLFDDVRFTHALGTVEGDRYRTASGLAARLTQRLEARLARAGRFAELRSKLRQFYWAGQTDKIAMANAA